MLLFQISWVFCLSATWKISWGSVLHIHAHASMMPQSLFFFNHSAINHFSLSQTLTTRSEMLFLALNVLLWNAAVRPYSSYFLHPAGVVFRSESIFLFTPSPLGRVEVQLSCLVFKQGFTKMCFWQRSYTDLLESPSLLPNWASAVASVNWKLVPLSEPLRLLCKRLHLFTATEEDFLFGL